jgi:hypothetical protein
MKPSGRELQRVVEAVAGQGPGQGQAPETEVSIGFVGTDSSAVLLSPGATFDVLTIAEAARRIVTHALTVPIIGVENNINRRCQASSRSHGVCGLRPGPPQACRI